MRLTKGKLGLRWTLLLGALLVGYLLAQPYLEQTFGIDLPGLADAAPAVQAEGQRGKESDRTNSAPRQTSSPKATREATSDFQKLTTMLKDRGREVYETPAGLRYTRGSQHGHRLKHVMAHAEDDPDRPGQHGVFGSSDPAEVIALVDEAYEQALTGKRTATKREGERTVYEVDLGRKIGYIGGQSGNRRNRPPARHLRLVVQGKNFITAFPVRP